ncbi:hypothetical protein B0F90DRAFT_1715778 [Multifurca ochricompacta]|uniref:Uncharacterized protein n=1 Tax=Multifurca ochricompacta TaxID=376703 RepID=A0AAD4M5E8_9AGAM|nr:hypothetical protein B0F90DRAFT_1715778 [Multifurca ochricompacta]
MSRVINVSNKLGSLLLEGWTLSDRTCPVEGCRGVPLLHSPEKRDSVTWFCPSCEGDGSACEPRASLSDPRQTSSPSLASSTHYSRSSTPATEDSHAPSSPTFATPVETEESIMRRQQSDFASSEIGNRLLKGWAMLADECPRSTCYGIPLVRPPKASRDKDPRKECVVCGTVYMTERVQGLDSLVPVTPSESRQEEIPSSSTPMKGTYLTLKGKEKAFKSSTAATVASSVSAAVGNSSIVHSTTPGFPTTSPVSRVSVPPLPTSSEYGLSEPISTLDDTLASSGKALAATLSSLSQRLLILSSQAILDPVTISQTADAIARTGQALAVINALRRNQD